MPFQERLSGKLPSPGPFLAEITNHLDPDYMGSVEVVLTKGLTNSINIQANTYPVRYLNPFYGVTSVRNEGTNSGDFNDVQKSYGMWMVPPDIGTTVMVIFIDGDPNQGFWIGCVQDKFQNHMVPGIAASHQTQITEEQRRKYGTDYLPVGEFLKATKDLNNPNVNSYKKPVHPFADRLLAQGLLLDTVRGVTSSSARREIPSSVFGISTPGPVDQTDGAQQGTFGYSGDETRQIPVTRLGGTTFVMDDGDINGQNELVRIRTRTGHQILLHNSHDLIYIANSKGTAWIELTSNGKIDIYAQDSVSIHSEKDFNFLANRDINFEAGRNLNMVANGNMAHEVVGDHSLVINGTSKQSCGGSFNLSAGSVVSMQAGGPYNLSSGGEMRLTSGGQLSVGASGNIVVAGSKVDINGPAPTAAAAPETPTTLERFQLPNRSDITSTWENSQFYKANNITSIMLRVPTHEPWDHHENTDPGRFSPDNTSVQTQPAQSIGNPTAPPGDVPVNKNPPAVPTSKSASSNEQYLESVLIAAGVTNKVKLAAIMAQCKIESAGFRALREYGSGAEYENRKDIGNTQPGDGIKYAGRGFLQCTGRDNYTKMTKYFKGPDFVSNPEIVQELEWAAKSVLWYFNVYKPPGWFVGLPKGIAKDGTPIMNQTYRDTEEFWSDVTSVTGLVNGGHNNLPERKVAFEYYMKKYANGIPNAGSTTASTSTGSVVVVGDSIAKGTGEALQKLIQGVKVSALIGAGSPEILKSYVPAVTGADIAVVSAGSNDIGKNYPESQTLQQQKILTGNLKKIRTTLNAKRYIWLVPHFDIPAKVVTDFANANGDQTVTFETNPRENPELHPTNYNTVAQAVKRLIG